MERTGWERKRLTDRNNGAFLTELTKSKALGIELARK